MPHPLRIRTDDTVIVTAGKDKGKSGKVLRVDLKNAKVYVEGLNIAKRHTKPRQSTNTNDRVPRMQQGGILEIPQPLPIGRVMLVCSNCKRPTRIIHATLDTGRRVRICRHCGQQMEARA